MEWINKNRELVRNAFGPDYELENLHGMERPVEWIGDACVIDFNSWPVENLSITIKNIFENANYRLEEGTPTNAIYGTGSTLKRLLIGWMAFRYKFKVEIYSNEETNTFLKISKNNYILTAVFVDGAINGNPFYNEILDRIIEVLKYLQPNYDGYLVCQKCGGYYKLQPGELPENFDVCQCGGELENHHSINLKK
ncbi:MAG: hypothetical protein ACC609_07840 [Methanobacterium formicicum]